MQVSLGNFEFLNVEDFPSITIFQWLQECLSWSSPILVY